MNYRSLANKGRKGDSEIRNVAGRRSHVNKREANLIDMLGRKGEALTQALGAGTRNPKTGMPEYHKKDFAHNLLGNIGESFSQSPSYGFMDPLGQKRKDMAFSSEWSKRLFPNNRR